MAVAILVETGEFLWAAVPPYKNSLIYVLSAIEAIDLAFRLHGTDRSTKLHNAVFAISGCTRLAQGMFNHQRHHGSRRVTQSHT